MNTYLAHSTERGRQYTIIKRDIEALGISVYDPPDNAGSMDSRTDHECKEYVKAVTEKVNECDVVIAVPEDGYYEVSFIMMLARSMGKRVYVLTEEFRSCPWFRIYSDCIFHDWDAFKAFLLSRLP